MSARDDILALQARVAELIVGQQHMIEQLLLGLLADGNLLVAACPDLPRPEPH